MPFPSQTPERKILKILLENYQKSAVKHSIENTILIRLYYFGQDCLTKNIFCLFKYFKSLFWTWNWYFEQESCDKDLTLKHFKKQYFCTLASSINLLLKILQIATNRFWSSVQFQRNEKQNKIFQIILDKIFVDFFPY